ncbi:MAG: aspartate carbamoyltransferase catalytic subunit [Candidatus Aenigmarchaeota archaeon]|nr:aspartate carbamoyltransferase catalytic subunit [Candidatus Aenigmarchaeota archaeon]
MWDRKSLLSASQFSRSDVEEIISLASRLKQKPERLCSGKILANIFFEPSTRTEKSFQAAMYRLGGSVISHKDAGSSREKGETKKDTIRILSSYADIAVIRDNESGRMQEYTKAAGVPVISGGDGSNEHPTQMLTDAFTIKEEIGRLDNLKVAFIGDLKYGRTVHSLMQLLSKFSGNEIFSIAPASLSLPSDMKSMEAGRYDISQLREALAETKPDAVYCTRIQKERLNGEKGSYVVDSTLLSVLPPHCRIMHPLPRVNEMNVEIDADKRVIPFVQAANGVPVRMAIIAKMLGGA